VIEFYSRNSGFCIDVEDLKYLVKNDLVEDMIDILFSLSCMESMEENVPKKDQLFK
jgi:hypothetical protein